MTLPATMAAAVRTSAARNGVEVLQLPLPQPEEDKVLIRVRYCGLCGSDLHIWNGDDGYDWVPCGTVLGHEIVGSVARIGGNSGIHMLKPGDRVVAIAQSGCGDCPGCLTGYANGCPEKLTLGLSHDGGAAQYVQIPPEQLLVVPGGISTLTAVLTEPLSVAARAVAERGKVTSADTVVVSGPGTIGILCALVCRHLGAAVVLKGTESDVATRSVLALSLGLELRAELPPKLNPTVWVEAAGAGPALIEAIRSLPVRGRLVVVALYGQPPTLPVNEAVRKELDVLTSYSSHRTDYELAMNILESLPDLGDKLVEVMPLLNIAAAFQAVGGRAAPKVAVSP